VRTHLLPGSDGISNDTIHRLREGRCGLVDWNIEQTDRIGGKYVARARDSDCIALPADAADPQPENLVITKPSEEPGRRERPAQLDGITVGSKVPSMGRATTWKIVGNEVEASPDGLGPHIVGDDPRVGADQSGETLRYGQMPHGIEPSRDQVPLLKIPKEDPQRGGAARASAWGEYLASASNMNGIDASPVPTMPLADDGDEFRCKMRVQSPGDKTVGCTLPSQRPT